MGIRKREAMPQIIRTWLRTNRDGKLTSDQWLNLLTAPLLTLIALAIPFALVFALTPARLLLRFGVYGRLLIPFFLVGVIAMLVLRARHYARLPLYEEVLYADETTMSLVSRLRGRMTLYTQSGVPIVFDGFALSPPQLEHDIPYMTYYLEEPSGRTLLSYAPLNHPDIDRWSPTEKFYERQQKRGHSTY